MWGKLQLIFTGSFDKKIKLCDHIPVPETTIVLAVQLLEDLSVSMKGLRTLKSRQVRRNLLHQILNLRKLFREKPLSRKYS